MKISELDENGTPMFPRKLKAIPYQFKESDKRVQVCQCGCGIGSHFYSKSHSCKFRNLCNCKGFVIHHEESLAVLKRIKLAKPRIDIRYLESLQSSESKIVSVS